MLLSGNTQRPSRSRALAAFIGNRLMRHLPYRPLPLDVLDAGRALGAAYCRSELAAKARAVVDAIEQADALVVVTPVYQGSYPGLFKHLMDFVEPRALTGTPVLLGATGGGYRHTLVVDHQLRPLFGFFAAQVSGLSIYASEDEFSNGVPTNDELVARIDKAVLQFSTTVRPKT